MKNLNNFIKINESQTKLSNIENYGKTWVTEYEPHMFEQLLTSLLNGIKKGLNENLKYYKEDTEKQDIEKGLNLINTFEETIKENK